MNRQPYPRFLNSKIRIYGFEMREIMFGALAPLILTYFGFPDDWVIPTMFLAMTVQLIHRKFVERGYLHFKFVYKPIPVNEMTYVEEDNERDL